MLGRVGSVWCNCGVELSLDLLLKLADLQVFLLEFDLVLRAQVSVALVEFLHLEGHLVDGLVALHFFKLQLLESLLDLLSLTFVVGALRLQVANLLIH